MHVLGYVISHFALCGIYVKGCGLYDTVVFHHLGKWCNYYGVWFTLFVMWGAIYEVWFMFIIFGSRVTVCGPYFGLWFYFLWVFVCVSWDVYNILWQRVVLSGLRSYFIVCGEIVRYFRMCWGVVHMFMVVFRM